MSATVDFGYNYVFDLALRLSAEEQAQLLRELSGKSLSSQEKRESFLPESDATPYSPDEFYEFLLRGPVIDEEHIRLMQDAREEVNRCGPMSW